MSTERYLRLFDLLQNERYGILKKYKVQFVTHDGIEYFTVNCTEDRLEYWKDICKCGSDNGVCFYRQYPLTGAKKIYF